MKPEINWFYWRTFLAVLASGSLSAAAKNLRITQPTAGRHIDELEEFAGGTLFTRSQKGLLPTALATALEPTALAMADAAHALTRRARANTPTIAGTVRITASEIVGVEILPAVFHGLQQKHPDTKIELALSNDQDDLLNRNADIAVRMVEPRQERLVRTKIGTAVVGMYGSKTYLGNQPLPTTAKQLLAHKLIGVDRDNHRLAHLKLAGNRLTADNFAFRCDSDVGQLAALRAGVGLGVAQTVIANRICKRL